MASVCCSETAVNNYRLHGVSTQKDLDMKMNSNDPLRG
jgi:hypothetical protein